ncbi:MAG: hypothetical protein OXI01_02750 [Albidovulum sp.]|nr:hypothetical protein [Albidovulum sp.]
MLRSDFEIGARIAAIARIWIENPDSSEIVSGIGERLGNRGFACKLWIGASDFIRKTGGRCSQLVDGEPIEIFTGPMSAQIAFMRIVHSARVHPVLEPVIGLEIAGSVSPGVDIDLQSSKL